MAVPLYYSYPAFRPGGYANAAAVIARLAGSGVDGVTFTVTYPLQDGPVPLVRAREGPGLPEVREAVRLAVEAGLAVRLEPHLDWRATLSSGPYAWRRRAYVDPFDALGAYRAAVLEPLWGLLAEHAGQSAVPLSLTLGAELDVSLVAFAEQWQDQLAQLREGARGSQVRLLHKINHDTPGGNDGLWRELDGERERRGLARLSSEAREERWRAAAKYFGALDAVSVSLYAPLPFRRSTAWWEEPTTADHVAVVGEAFARLLTELRTRLPGGRPPCIGEFGLGCADPNRSFDFRAETFLDDTGRMRPGAAEMRRKYYLGLLACLRARPELVSPDGACFWTVTHYDFLDALEQQYRAGANPDAAREFFDPVLADALRA